MNQPLMDNLARALLYEGYVLYPYRPSSVKNQQRWTFGGVYPPAWSAAQEGTDPCIMQTQCLLEPGSAAMLSITIRFLHLVDRTVGELLHPMDDLPAEGDPAFRQVPGLDVGRRHYQAWQEAVEREVNLEKIDLRRLLVQPHPTEFSFPRHRAIEPLRLPTAGAPITAILIRTQEKIYGEIELSATTVHDKLVRISVRVLNRTQMTDPANSPRDHALLRSFISTHTILAVEDGKFISLTDPPSQWRHHASECVNIGVWPILVGAPGEHDAMLASPIIVEDYPKIAPESPGDLFDGTEIDEILTLRIMTMTDEEKRLAAGSDDRVCDLMSRTQSLARDQLAGLHGTFRGLTPLPHEPGHHDGGRASVKKITVQGAEIKAGDSVRLRPLGRADVMDIALDGKMATIVSIEQDFENRIYVAVTIDDDPGKDLGLLGQPGHRFFFGIEEIEPMPHAEVAT